MYMLSCVFHGVQDGLTALHHAAIGGQEEAVRVLVQEFKVDPDIPDVVSNLYEVDSCMHALMYT